VVLSDTGNNRIQIFDPTGEVLKEFGSSSGILDSPLGLAVDWEGKIYVANTNRNRADVFNSAGEHLFSTQYVYRPSAVAVDSSGRIYVTEPTNNRIKVFYSNGIFLRSFGSTGSEEGQFRGPYEIAIDALDNLFITDKDNNRIQKYNTNDTVLTIYGAGGAGEGRFYLPEGLSTDKYGRVFVADTWNHRVQILDDFGPGSDHTPPTVWLDESLSSVIQGATIEVVGTVIDAHLSHYILSYRPAESEEEWTTIHTGYQEVENDILGVWHALGLNGLYTLRLWAMDLVYNQDEIVLNIQVDGVAPDPPIFYDLPIRTNQRNIDVIGSAEAHSRVDLWINESAAGTTFANDEGQFILNAVALPMEGINTLKATATDALGNQSDPAYALESI